MHLGLLLFAVLAALFAAIFVWQFMKPRRAVTAFDTLIYEEETKPKAWYVELVRLRAGWGVICWTVIAIGSFVASFAIPQMEQARQDRLDATSTAWERCTVARDLLGDGSIDDIVGLQVLLEGSGFVLREDRLSVGRESFDVVKLIDTGQSYLDAFGVDELRLGTIRDRFGNGLSVDCRPSFPR